MDVITRVNILRAGRTNALEDSTYLLFKKVPALALLCEEIEIEIDEGEGFRLSRNDLQLGRNDLDPGPGSDPGLLKLLVLSDGSLTVVSAPSEVGVKRFERKKKLHFDIDGAVPNSSVSLNEHMRLRQPQRANKQDITHRACMERQQQSQQHHEMLHDKQRLHGDHSGDGAQSCNSVIDATLGLTLASRNTVNAALADFLEQDRLDFEDLENDIFRTYDELRGELLRINLNHIY